MDPKGVAGGGLRRKTTCPFGEGFYSKVAKLMMSSDDDSLDELKKLAQMNKILESRSDPYIPKNRAKNKIKDSKKSADEELWDSGDDMAGSFDILKAPIQKKTAPERIRVITAPPMDRKRGAFLQPTVQKIAKVAEETKKKEERVLPTTLDLDEEDSSGSDKDKNCFKCKSNSALLENALLTCGHCSTSFHQRCHSPIIETKQANDPAFFFLCSSCNAQSKPKSRSGSPKPQSSTLKKDDKPKISSKMPDGLSAEFEKFRKKNMQRLTKK